MKKFLIIVIVLVGLFYFCSLRPIPNKISYGISFSVLHSNELKLDWKKVYDGLLNDLNIKKFRLSAHWPMIEPQQGHFNWSEMDYQISQAEKHDAKVVLAVGRRLPGWPECHEPEWAYFISKDEKRAAILNYVTQVVNRYKNSSAIEYWQVENEPFLTGYATYYCHGVSDKDFLKEEVALVKSLDPKHQVLVTDSGEIGMWYNAWSTGDLFGTSLYRYIWNQWLGPISYPIPPAYFRFKRNLMELIAGKKQSILIELSAEPWLIKPITETDIDTQLKQMNIDRFNSILEFAKNSSFETQYLWGGEWWYYMKQNGHPEFWERAKEIYKNN